MKKTVKIILAAVLLAAAGAAFPFIRNFSDEALLRKPEDEIYAKVCRLDTDRLIRKINRIENKYPDMTDKVALLPLYTALTERSSEFTADQLIAQIRREETQPGIEEAFVNMYAAEGYDSAGMLALLDDPETAEETKDYITAHCDLTPDELCGIFRGSDGRPAVIAIQRLAAADSETAMQLVDEFVSGAQDNISDQKYIAICLGIAQYYEEHTGPEDIESMKNIYIPMMKTIFENGKSDPVRDQAVYALGRLCDYDLFAWLIENEHIDKYCKISVTERNYRQMKTWIAEAKSEDDIRAVLDAMRIMPTLEIADALEEAITQGNLPESAELRSLIETIRAEGVHAVDKYD